MLQANQKLAKNTSLLKTAQKASGRDTVVLSLDIAPFLPDLLAPKLRSVSGQLYSSKERADLTQIVNVMIDFGLSLIQEKQPDGGTDYNLDPLVYIVIFQCFKQ